MIGVIWLHFVCGFLIVKSTIWKKKIYNEDNQLELGQIIPFGINEKLQKILTSEN